MAVNGGPKIPTDGLVLNLDFANFKSNRGRRSLINWNEWTSGSGGTTSYARNGLESENRRIWDTNPFGNSDIVWDSPTNDTDLNGDGGWNYYYIPIDPTKMYRHSVWIRRPTIGNGSTYLGTHGFTDTTNTGVLYRSTGGSTTNAYFISTGWWGAANSWYLVTGHTWPYGSGTGSAHADSGIYAANGTKVANSADFVWKTITTNKTSHRSYLFYSSNTSTNQQWYQPRIDLCDGTEPTLQELLNDAGNKITDISYNGNDGLITGSMAIDGDNLGSYDFDGTNDYIDLGNISASGEMTIIAWIKTPSTLSGNKHIVDSSSNTWHLALGDNKLYFYNSSTYHATYNDYATLSANTTYMVVGRQSTTNDIFVDGELVKSLSSNVSLTTNNVVLGKWQNGGRYFDGNIYSVAIYDKALTADEIKTLYNSQRGRFGL